ncbi:hypothetical protein LEP1GSC168_0842 [Leptospira santarosai str. HAI134]|nr:hypothetical protein LEP1GSC168_0842 [Leptospira santarosai str. HAI134]
MDLNPILVRLPLFYDPAKQKKDRSIRKEPIGEVLDDRIVRDAEKALEGKSSMALSYLVRNTNRTVGAKISGLIARKYGSNSWKDAGSLGAWLVKGVQITLHGDANDYVGKGLCGGVDRRIAKGMGCSISSEQGICENRGSGKRRLRSHQKSNFRTFQADRFRFIGRNFKGFRNE